MFESKVLKGSKMEILESVVLCIILGKLTYTYRIFLFHFRAEYSAFWKCVQAGVTYLLTQLCKMLILATFFPASEAPAGSFDVVGVSITCEPSSFFDLFSISSHTSFMDDILSLTNFFFFFSLSSII